MSDPVGRSSDDQWPASPQQRRLAGVIADGRCEPLRTVCSVDVSWPVDLDELMRRAGPLVRRLFTDTSVPITESVVRRGPSAGDVHAPGTAYFAATAAGFSIDLPAVAADEPTVVALLSRLLGDDPSGAEALPYRVAARWWNEESDAAAADDRFWAERAAAWPVEPPPVFGGTRNGDRAIHECRAELPVELFDNGAVDPAPWILASWQSVLRRRVGTGAIVVGVAHDLRRHEELHDCEGPLIAYLPVRNDTALELPLAAHAQQATTELADCADRAEWFSWANLLDDAAGTLAYAFTHRSLPRPFLSPAGRAHITAVDSRCDRIGLRLIALTGPVQISMVLEFDADLVDPQLAADLLAEVRATVENGRHRPQVAVDALVDLPPAVERRLAGWGTGDRTEPGAGSLVVAFNDQTVRTPQAVSVRQGATRLTYRELGARVDGLAAALRNAGIGAEDRVGVYLPSGIDLLIAQLAVMSAEAAYVYLDPAYPGRRLRTITEDSAARLVIVDDADPGIGVPAMPVSSTAPPGPDTIGVPHPDTLAYLIYTSGSTGRPKGVQVTHRGLYNYLTALAPDYPQAPDSLVSTSPAFDLALPALYLPLLSGGTVTFAGQLHADPAALLDELGAHPYDLVRATPSQLAMLRAEMQAPPIGDPLIALGGELLGADLVRDVHSIAPNLRLANYYGPTETVGARVRGPVDDRVTGSIPLGAPIANTNLRVLDASGRPVALGVTGELFIGGEGIARGYNGQPGHTASRFVPDSWGPPGARLFRTGDLVRWLPGARLEYVGRADDQVKIRGFRIEPGEAAAAVRSHPGVRDAAVIPHERADGTYVLAAYAVPTSQQVEATSEQVWQHLADLLPAHLLPTTLTWIDALPLTANGKVDRQALPQPSAVVADRHDTSGQPGNEVERLLAEAWSEALGMDQISVHDNFFAIGGDSILSIMVASHAAKRGLKLSLRHFFEHQTIAAMAPHAERTSTDPSADGLAAALTPIQRRFFDQPGPPSGHWNQGWLFEPAAGLRPDVLAAAVEAIVAQHSALASVFVPDSSAPGGHRVERIDVRSGAFKHIEIPAGRWASDLTPALEGLQKIDLTSGPMLRVALIDGGVAGRRLAFIAHHLAIDIVSWQILFDDLTSAYEQLMAGRPAELAPASTSPDVWGAHLTGATGRAAADLDYWLAQSPPGLSPLPVDRDGGPAMTGDQRTVRAGLDAARTHTLTRRMTADTRPDHTLTAAVARAFARWSDRSSIQISVEGQGRDQDLVPGVDLHRSVGWFTSLAPVLLDVPAAGTLETLRSIRAQLLAAPRDGLTYGVLRYLDPIHSARLAERPSPQISVNYVGSTGAGVAGPGRDRPLTWKPAPESLPPLIDPRSPATRLWTVNAVAGPDGLEVALTYAGGHYDERTAQTLADAVVDHLRELVDAWDEAGGLGSAPDRCPPTVAGRPGLEAALAKAIARAPRRVAAEQPTGPS